MVRLRARDLRAALDFTLQARATDDLPAFRNELVPSLRRLVPCGTLGYTEIDLELGHGFSISDGPALDGVEQRFLELSHQHPMVGVQRRGDLSPHLISDFLSERRFHRLELYQDIYRHMEVEDQLAFGLSGESIVAIHLTRNRRTFTERDRQMLELVRPHLRLAYAHARENERMRELMKALDSALEERNIGAIQLDGGARIEQLTAAASELLEAYFAERRGDPHRLPRQIREWLDRPASIGSARELTVEGCRGRLRIREHELAADRDWRVLILEEQRGRVPELERVRMLGLTTRQAQVLRLLACGKRSAQVAAELGISPATVNKHLEHIFERLGVSSRAEAIARIYG